MCLNSSSSSSMKKIPRNSLALSSSGFSIAHFCFALLFASSDKCFHISGHTLSGLEVVCFLVSLLPDHENPSGGLSFGGANLVKPVHASDNSFSLVPTIHQVTYVWFWSRQCISMELGMSLLSARRTELEVRRDDDK